MGETVGGIIGLGFLFIFVLLLCGGGIAEFLEKRREQKFRHEREMAKIAARKAKDDRP